MFLAGLQGIPENYYEAAKIDGAGPATTFFRIAAPLAKPAGERRALTATPDTIADGLRTSVGTLTCCARVIRAAPREFRRAPCERAL